MTKKFSKESLNEFLNNTKGIKNIEFYIDVSGPILDETISLCYSIIKEIVDQSKTKLHNRLKGKLNFFDFKIISSHNFKNINNILDKKPKAGRGGTSFLCTIADLNMKNKNNDTAAIILTDGFAPISNINLSNAPLLWVLTNNDIKPSWGEYNVIKE